MNDKNSGLYQKYVVQNITNPTKKVDAIVLEFDDPLSRVGIAAFAEACDKHGFHLLSLDIRKKLEETEKLPFGEQN